MTKKEYLSRLEKILEAVLVEYRNKLHKARDYEEHSEAHTSALAELSGIFSMLIWFVPKSCEDAAKELYSNYKTRIKQLVDENFQRIRDQRKAA